MTARDTLRTYAGTPCVLPDDMLDAALDAYRGEVLGEAAAELDRIADAIEAGTKPGAQILRDAAGNVRYLARQDTSGAPGGESTQPAPDLHSRVHAALCRGNAPLLPLPKETVRALATRVTDAIAPLVAYRPVWDSSLPPGGNVCSICGAPVESEPCGEHAPTFFQPGHTYRINDGADRADFLGWIFHAEHTSHRDGKRVAFGYLTNRYPGATWNPHSEGEESWTSGWDDITEDGGR